MRNKIGAAFDIIYYSLATFTVAATFLVVWEMWDSIRPALQNIGHTAEINASIAAGTAFTGMFDMMFIGAAVFALFAVMLILAMMIPVSPVFYIIYFIYLMIATLISPILSNAYETMATSAVLAGAAAAMPMQTYFMDQLPLFILMFGIILIIATYAKYGTGGGSKYNKKQISLR